MAEWFKAHAWKAWGVTRLVGSNPTRSVHEEGASAAPSFFIYQQQWGETAANPFVIW